MGIDEQILGSYSTENDNLFNSIIWTGKNHRFECTNLPWETKYTFLTQIKPIERADDLFRIRRNVDNIFGKDSSATLLKRIRRQSDIVTNGKSY